MVLPVLAANDVHEGSVTIAIYFSNTPGPLQETPPIRS
jgi:hypothetical protein